MTRSLLALALTALASGCSHPWHVRADVFALAPDGRVPPEQRGALTVRARSDTDGKVEVSDDTGPLFVTPSGPLEGTPLQGARVTWSPCLDGAWQPPALALPAGPERGRWYFSLRSQAGQALSAVRVRIEAPGCKPVEAEVPLGDHAYQERCLVGFLEPE